MKSLFKTKKGVPIKRHSLNLILGKTDENV